MVERFEKWFYAANDNRKIHVYLPEDYYYSNERYPVIYFFDGNNLFFDWDALFGMSLQLNDFLNNYHKKVIVVGIEQPRNEYERIKEHCPYHVYSLAYGEIWGTGHDLVNWVVYDLKPHIDYVYRTQPFRECTAIAGCSSAGLTALYGISKYNMWFSKCVAISPAILANKWNLERTLNECSLSPDTKVFFSYGTNEYGDNYQMREDSIKNIYEAEAHLQQKGAQTFIYQNEGGNHNEIDWRKEIGTWMWFLWQ